jgi:hypothetical protein
MFLSSLRRWTSRLQSRSTNIPAAPAGTRCCRGYLQSKSTTLHRSCGAKRVKRAVQSGANQQSTGTADGMGHGGTDAWSPRCVRTQLVTRAAAFSFNFNLDMSYYTVGHAPKSVSTANNAAPALDPFLHVSCTSSCDLVRRLLLLHCGTHSVQNERTLHQCQAN